ncbi:MAG: WGR domain-containing protein [Planctomycetes bacterium]|nr:WGR domain-containing protein [Planctomycetota bacterium]
MLKLYREDGGRVVAYHEAWVADSKVIEHWGPIGTRGQTREHAYDASQPAEEAIRKVLSAAMDAGYHEIDMDDHATLVVEYEVDDMGTEADLALRQDLEARLGETLGWLGLGHVDGGSIGSGTMEVFCFVVDYDLAREAVEQDLADSEIAHYRRIFDEDAD